MNYDEQIVLLSILHYDNESDYCAQIDRLSPSMRFHHRELAVLLEARQHSILAGEHDSSSFVSRYVAMGGDAGKLFDIAHAGELHLEAIVARTSLVSAVNRIIASNKSIDFANNLEEYRLGNMSQQELAASIAFADDSINEDFMSLEEAERKVDTEGERSRVKSGFKRLDYRTRGFSRGRVTILGARPGVGKTDFALTIAANVVEAGGKVFFACMEMDHYEIVGRLRRNYGSLRNINRNFMLNSAPSQSVMQIVAQANHEKPDLVVVDYLQILHLPESGRMGMYEKASTLSNQLRVAAKGNSANASTAPAWLVLSQLSRNTENENNTPLLSHLRDSGAIEQDADTVMFLHEPNKRTEMDEYRKVQLTISKNRSGACGWIDYRFIMGKSRWEEE